MATFVLVHGAGSGGWQMRAVASGVRTAGHDIFTPTLTGLGERSHLLSRDITLDTHIQDLANVLYFEDLRDVILIGKSYSGMVVTGVAERMPERLSRLMYIDAAVPQDGESLMDVIRPEVGAHIAERVQTHGQGWLVTFESSDPRSTPQPFQTFTQPLAVKNPAATAIPRTYFYCTNTQAGGGIFLKSAQRAREQGWHYYELHSAHVPEQTMPRELAQMLVEAAR